LTVNVYSIAMDWYTIVVTEHERSNISA
jgi:hypothetical protein